VVAEIIIEDIPGLIGSYELDLSRFTNDELRLIKRESGVRAGEFEEALQAGDNDLLVCFALVALNRAGIVAAAERLWEADAGRIHIDLTSEEEEDDAGPPDVQRGSLASEPANPGSSLQFSNGASEFSQETSTPSATGNHG